MKTLSDVVKAFEEGKMFQTFTDYNWYNTAITSWTLENIIRVSNEGRLRIKPEPLEIVAWVTNDKQNPAVLYTEQGEPNYKLYNDATLRRFREILE